MKEWLEDLADGRKNEGDQADQIRRQSLPFICTSEARRNEEIVLQGGAEERRHVMPWLQHVDIFLAMTCSVRAKRWMEIKIRGGPAMKFACGVIVLPERRKVKGQ